MSQLPSITPATNHRSQSSTTFNGSPPPSDSDTSSPNSTDASSAMDEESQHSLMLSALNGIDSEIDDDYHSAEKISDRDLIADAIENDM